MRDERARRGEAVKRCRGACVVEETEQGSDGEGSSSSFEMRKGTARRPIARSSRAS